MGSEGLDLAASRPSEESQWAGPSGERWLANVDRFEAMIRPIGEVLIERAAIKPGETIIDVGCGAGPLTLEIARRVAPGGMAIGLDISPALIDEATRRAAALPQRMPAHFVLGDAARVVVPGSPADCLVSRFGVMFFSDPYAAFTHLRGLLRPGGRVVLACWGPLAENPWMSEFRAVLSRHFELPPMVPRAPGPYAFAEPDYLRDILSKAAFKDVRIDPWRGTLLVGGEGLTPGPAADFLVKAFNIAQLTAELPDSVQRTVRRDVAAWMEPFATLDGIRINASVWMATAVA